MSQPNRERQAPYWYAPTIQERLDLPRLRPPSLPKGRRFETLADADALSLAHEHALRHGSQRAEFELAAILADCGHGHRICGSPACPLCARRYRRWLFAQAFRIWLKNRSGAKTLTVYLAEFPEGQLVHADLARLHAALRAHLRRSGFSGSVVIGGTEVRYRASDHSWLVHVHLLTAPASQDAIDKFTEITARTQQGDGDPVEIDDVNDPVEQLSYLQKFATFHRPGKQTSNRRPRAYPIPPVPLRELLLWMANYTFDDFRFLFGARRRGARIKKEKKTRA